MEKIFFVMNGDLNEVNQALTSGGRVKMIVGMPQSISAFGYATGGNQFPAEKSGAMVGHIFAYVVVEYDKQPYDYSKLL